MIRLEVQASEQDAELIRHLVKTLREAGDADQIREQLQQITGFQRKTGLKELLASAPLEDIDLSRARDMGRDVDL